MRFIGRMNYQICILKMNVMIKRGVIKAIKETKESEVAHYRYNEYLKMARKIIFDSYINWYTYDKI